MSPLNFAGSFLFGVLLPCFIPVFFEREETTGSLVALACCFLAALVFINRKD